MYILKNETNLEFKNQRMTAEEIGISKDTLSRILNRRKTCSKPIAYSIVKHFNAKKDVEDYFEKVD